MRYSLDDLKGRSSLLDDRVVRAQKAVEAAASALEDARSKLQTEEAIRDGAREFLRELQDDFDSADEPSGAQPPRASKVPAPPTTAGEVYFAGLPLRRARVRSTRPGNKEIIADLLDEFPTGVDLRDLQAEARKRDLGLDDDQVRSAVTYLSRTDRAVNLQRGRWISVAQYKKWQGNLPTNQSAPAPDLPQTDDTRSRLAGAG